MPRSASSPPPGFSWLHPAYRPSEREVDAYAHIIANAEGYPGESNTSRLLREAELQLWIWRTETKRRPYQRVSKRRGNGGESAGTAVA
jgi:hypothetical protein